MKPRKNILLSTQREFLEYAEAFSKMAQRKDSGWHQLSQIMREKLQKRTMYDAFWLRLFLFKVEKLMQKFNPNVMLLEPKNQLLRVFGGVPNGECWILKGFNLYRAVSYRNWDKTCIKRHTKEINSFLKSSQTIDNYFISALDITFLHDQLRDLWPNVTNNEFIPYQPEDPKFLAHMTFLDKIYFDWQMRNRDLANYALVPPDTLIHPFNVSLKQVVNTCNRLCYSYQEEHFSWDRIGEWSAFSNKTICPESPY
ncbi:hypothetical protein L0F63_000184 [Massospora cicadina]|nr:hypothetical protein L0F63_000184 [Massospora cicadina]